MFKFTFVVAFLRVLVEDYLSLHLLLLKVSLKLRVQILLKDCYLDLVFYDLHVLRTLRMILRTLRLILQKLRLRPLLEFDLSQLLCVLSLGHGGDGDDGDVYDAYEKQV